MLLVWQVAYTLKDVVCRDTCKYYKIAKIAKTRSVRF